MNELIVTILGLIPVYALVISYMEWINLYGKKLLLLACLGLETIIVYTAFFPVNIPKVTSYLQYYAFFILFYMMLLIARFKYQINTIFALVLLMVFVGADIWELPIFVYGTMRLFNVAYILYAGQWFDHIHRIYALASAILIFKIGSLRLNKVGLMLISASVIASFVLCVDINLLVLARVVTLTLFGFGIVSCTKSQIA